jgi:hypothetical protein
MHIFFFLVIGALPISRDTPSYVAVISILSGGEAGQLEYGLKKGAEEKGGGSSPVCTCIIYIYI